MSDDPRLGLGANFPPEPTVTERLSAIDPERLIVCDVSELPVLFGLQYAALIERAAELTQGVDRWKEAHKNGAISIADDTENDALSDWMRQLRDFAGDDGEVESTRKRVKRVVYEAGKVIDAYFGELGRPIMTAHGPSKHAMVGTLQYAQTQYLLAKEAKARAERERIAREAEALAREQAEEARRLAEAGRDAEADKATDRALETEAAAQAMTQDAQAPARDLVRSRSALGTTTSLAGSWDATVTDIKALCRAIADGKAPETFVAPEMAAIRQAIRRKVSPMRECAGLKIEQTYSARRSGT
jgi:hypothetical protein